MHVPPRSDLMPGGVNSPVRSFAAVGRDSAPLLAASAAGAVLRTPDGREYIDYIQGWGAVITGHAHPAVIKAVATQASDGLGYGLSTALEAEFAHELAQRTGLPMSRAVNSGTEATMTAVRVARGHTGRDLLVKFAGCYHGHADALLVAAGSGGLTFGTPSSAGVPAGAAKDTLVLPYNDAAAVHDCLARHGDQVAAVILEPIAGNMNLVVPDQDFIDAVADGCATHGALLIDDEVMTGLRATPGLALRDHFGVEPDIACLGKVIGGGLPVAALAGRREVMANLAPLGKVYQAGTLAGNPVCLAAGLATLRLLDQDAHDRLAQAASGFATALEEEASRAGVDLRARHIGGMAGYYLAASAPADLAAVEACDDAAFRRFHAAMLDAGVLLPPSRFEACFVGLGHDPDVLTRTRLAARAACAVLAA